MSDGMQIQIDVSISDYRRGNGQLRLSEQVTIPDAGFDTMAEILAGFHIALQAVREAASKTEAGDTR